MEGNPEVWRVENGAITAVSTAERRVGSTHIIWQGGEPADFELKLEVKLDGDIHSGIAYRSVVDVNARLEGRAPVRPRTKRRGRTAGAVRSTVDVVWAGPRFRSGWVMAGNVEERGTPRREIAWRGGSCARKPENGRG